MRTVVISCDRCGKEIKGYPVKIVTEYVDRETGDILPDNDERLPEWAEKTLDKDFCEDCTRKIVRFALGGLKENPEFKKAVDDMVNSDTPPNRGKDDQVSGISGNEKRNSDMEPVNMAQIDCLEEMVKDIHPEKKVRNRIDHGKVMALTKAGWSAAQIADEMGLNVQAVYDARCRLKKEGKL